MSSTAPDGSTTPAAEPDPPTILQAPRPDSPTVSQPAWDADPPTILQHPPASHAPRTRRDRGDAPTVLQHPDGGDPPTVLQNHTVPQNHTGAPAPAAARGSDGGPQRHPLHRLGGGRFTPVPCQTGSALLGEGAEAQVWLAHDSVTGRLVAVKVYRVAPQWDERRMETLADPRFTDRVPQLFDRGLDLDEWGQRCGWEAMEYFPHGSLADLFDQERAPGAGLPEPRARAVLDDLAETLRYWEHVIGLRQIDLSPGNVMLRGLHPVHCVLSDFGGVRGTGLSQAVTDLQVKLGYMAPEALANAQHAASPYWSLGMMMLELLTGRRVSGGLDDTTVRIVLATGDVDVTAVEDPRWQLALAGLLTRDPERRWQHDQVRDWLHGGTPPVARALTPTSATVPAPAAREPVEPLLYRGSPYTDPRQLAAELVADPEAAITWLRSGGTADLRAWLADLGDDGPRLDTTGWAGVESDPDRAHLLIGRLAAATVPETTPMHRGAAIDVPGLRRLAQDPGRHDLLLAVVGSQALSVAAAHHCRHPRCTGGRCTVLARLNDALADAVGQATATVRSLSAEVARDSIARETGLPAVLAGATPARLCADITRLATDPGHAEQVVRRLRAAHGPDRPWWAEIRRDALRERPVEGRPSADGADDRAWTAPPRTLAACAVGTLILDRAQAYRRVQSHDRREQLRRQLQRLTRGRGPGGTATAGGGAARFRAPGWLAWLAMLLVPVAVLEPVYRTLVVPRMLAAFGRVPFDPTIATAARQVHAYTQAKLDWMPDWLTPTLGHLSPSGWRGEAWYPLLLLVGGTVLRRTQRARGARTTWWGVPAAVVVLLAVGGLVGRLMHQDLQPLWLFVAAMKYWTLLVVAVSFALARLALGPDRPRRNPLPRP